MDEAKLKKCLAAAIRRRRESLGYSQDRFADVLKMHRAQYAAIDRGEVNVTLQTLYRIASGLETTIAALAADAAI